MSDIFKAACVQTTSGPVIAENLKTLEGLVREAASKGAKFVLTPENSCHMRTPQTEKINSSLPEADHPAIPQFSNLAKELGIWLELGSIAIKISDTKIANRSYVFNPQGDIAGTYDKIHLFHVDLPGKETHREGALVTPGDEAVVVKTPWGGLGLSVCYDIRFSHLYRDLAKAGAMMITVPSAFTMQTGKAHWETLLRARAIETGSYILAAGQTGAHEGGRQTWGHSMIISPWGEILAHMERETGIIMADIDTAEVARVRGAIPALQHDRAYTIKA